MHFGLLSHSGGIDQHKVIAELVEMRLDGVARSARHRRDNVSLCAQKSVGHRRFAYVRFADYGNTRQFRELGRAIFALFRQVADDFIQQVACAASGCRRDAEQIIKP